MSGPAPLATDHPMAEESESTRPALDGGRATHVRRKSCRLHPVRRGRQSVLGHLKRATYQLSPSIGEDDTRTFTLGVHVVLDENGWSHTMRQTHRHDADHSPPHQCKHILAQPQRIAPGDSPVWIAVQWVDLPQRETVSHRKRRVQVPEACLALVHGREKHLAV